MTAELAASQAAALRQMEAAIPWLAGNAGRWAGEMDEIAETFAAAQVTPHFHQGAGNIYRLLASTEFAAETRETADRSRSLDTAVTVFAAATRRKGKKSAG